MSADRFLPTGPTADLIRARDWSVTPVGPIDAWPASLRTMLAVLLASPVPMVMLWGPEGVMLYNDAYSGFAGDRHPELLGSNVREGWPEVADFNDQVMRVVLAGGTLSYRDQELTLDRRGTPERVWMNLDYSPVPGDDGHPAGVLAIVIETTERVAADRRAREEEAKLQAALQQMPIGVSLAEVPSGRMTFLNDTGGDMLLGRHLPQDADDYAGYAALHADGRPYAAEDYPLLRAAAHGEVVRREPMIYRRGDDEVIRIQVSAARVLGPDGMPLMAACAFEDVTAQEAALQRLRDSEARVRLALDAGAIIGTWFWDVRADRFTVDEAFARAFGIDPALGREGLSLEQVTATVHPDDRAGLAAAIDEVISRCGRYAHQYRVRRADGEYYWIEANGRVDPGEDGRAHFFPGVLLDVHERRLVEEERDRARALLEMFTDAVPGVVYAKDPDSRMLVANRGTAQIVGKPMADIIGRTDAEFLDDPVQAAQTMANDRRVIETGETIQVEEEVDLPDGQRAVWFSTKSPLRDADGTVMGLIGASIDITARKIAEEKLAESEERFRFALEAAGGIGTWDWDVRADVVRTSEQFARMYGLDPVRAAAGLPVAEYIAGIHPDDRAEVERQIAAAVAGDGEYRAEYRLSGIDGEVRWVVARGRCFYDEAGTATRLPGVTFDITDRKRAEEALAESEHRYRTLFDTMDEGFCVVEFIDGPEGALSDYVHVEANRAYALNSGLEDIVGKRLREVLDEDVDIWLGLFRDVLLTGDPIRFEKALPETGRFLELAAFRLEPAERRQVAVIFNDVSARKRAEEELRSTSRRLNAILANTREAVFLMDDRQTCVYANAAAERLTGYTFAELSAKPLHDVIHHKRPDGSHYPLSECPIDRAFPERAQMTGEELFVAPDGSMYPVAFTASPVLNDAGQPIGTVIEARNITEEKARDAALRELNATLEQRVASAIAEREQAEEALRQAQKMEAVGQLTGGIAHDFNNLLTVVTGNIDMAGRALNAAGVTDARAIRALDGAMKGAERAAALTQRLLAFSRRQPLAPKSLDADKLVAGMSDLLNRALGETVQLEVVTSPGLWRVEADPNQLEAAILNLAVNARDAMPDGGTLTIETANARLDESYSAAHAEVAPGQYVVIAVTDTGQGMSRDTLARVFEPFFTTKEVGKGTGLGLSQVYGFTKQSGGHVKIYSEEGQGTTVKLYLPRLLSEETEQAASTPLATGLEASPRRETVLAVEDDDDVRAYTVECLRELGYRVLEAHDGPSAVRLMERQTRPIDLLFTDVVMPGMSGRELADELRRHQPDLRVLYTSGYTRNAIVHGGRLDEGVEMIAKPFTFQALATKVRDVLESGRTRRVLVVEAEPTVRAFAVETLANAGYAAEEAATGAESLMKVRAAQGRYDLVLLDGSLPDKSGESLVAELRALHADMPVLIATAERVAELTRQFAADRCVAILAKPYTGAKLKTALDALGLACPSER